MTIIQSFGARLQIIRKDKGLSQEKLAELSGLHRTYVSSLERGSRNPTLTTMQAIACALKVEISFLVKGISNE